MSSKDLDSLSGPTLSQLNLDHKVRLLVGVSRSADLGANNSLLLQYQRLHLGLQVCLVCRALRTGPMLKITAFRKEST